MALRAKKPTASMRRLKAMIWGESGTGKTTAVMQMKKPFIIDTERGTENYYKEINKVDGVVMHTTDIFEVIEEIKKLSTEKHDFCTLSLDSSTILYYELLQMMEAKYGTEFGIHFRKAGEVFKRMINLMMRLDMNIIITAHSKVMYGDNMNKIGDTFDTWKRIDYMFDLVLQLKKVTPTKRYVTVKKTRIEKFPDGETFEWNYDSLKERYSQTELERQADTITAVTVEQLAEIEVLSTKLADGKDFVDKCMRKARVTHPADLTTEQAQLMIDHFIKSLGLKTVGATK